MTSRTGTTLTFVTTIAALLAGTATGAVINVPGDQPTIQAGINAAVGGDEVVVAPGTYVEILDTLGKAITLRSSGGAGVTTIDGGALNSVLVFQSSEGPTTVVDGFTITNGDDPCCGGGLWIANASPTVRNCVFDSNTASAFGGAIYAIGSSSLIEGCEFRGNSADRGGAIYVNINSSVTVVNCLFDGNTALFNGGALYNDFGANTVVNCTMVNNSCVIGGGAIYNESSSPVVSSTIMWDNTPDQVDSDGASDPVLDNCDIQGGWAGSGSNNIDADPRFVDLAGGDLRLNRCSVCVDAGDNDAVPVGVVSDLDANPRFYDDLGTTDTGNAGVSGPPVVDIGAYELQVDSLPTTINVSAGQSVQTAIYAACDGDEIVIAPGTYNETIDFLGKGITVRSTDPNDPVVVAATIIDATGLGQVSVVTCRTFEEPDSVLDGLTITGGTGTIVGANVVGGGMHIKNDVFPTGPTVTNCVFSGNGTAVLGGGVYSRGGNPTIIGCTFSGNDAWYGGGFCGDFSGSPTISDCTFVGNTGNYGGGLLLTAGNGTVTDCVFIGNDANFEGGGHHSFSSDSAVSNCTFIGNSAPFGGGVANDGGSPPVTNCIFTGNVADSGGGFYNFNGGSSPTLVNCTFSGNDTSAGTGDGGAIWNTDANNLSVSNCVIWGNTPSQITDDDFNAATVDSSNVQGGWSGAGADNIDADPLFVDADGADDTPGTTDDDLRLMPGSPCVEVGSNALVPPSATTDLDGNARIIDGDYDGTADVDMGAYELDPDSLAAVANVTQGTLFDGIAVAIGAAAGGDLLIASLPAYQAEPSVDYTGKAITLRVAGPVAQPAGAVITMADDSALDSGTSSMTLQGDLTITTGTIDLATDELVVGPTGSLTGSTGAVINIVGATASTLIEGQLDVAGLIDSPTGLEIRPTGTMTMSGFILADTTNDNQAAFEGDSSNIGDYTNNGTTDVNNGTLTVVGSLTNNGTINGSVVVTVAGEVIEDYGLDVSGDLVIGPAASLLMPSSEISVRVAGDFDVALTDNLSFDMVQAELRLTGAVQNVEAMSIDVGDDPDGLDRTLPGHFPIGALRIEPGTTVNMIDDHDNDGQGQGQPEGIYVETLVVEAGSTLNTLGTPVYYGTLQLDGDVDDPGNLVEVPVPQPCLADTDGDGFVSVTDLLGLLAAWGTGAPSYDIAPAPGGDGAVDVLDLLALLGAWGPCP